MGKMAVKKRVRKMRLRAHAKLFLYIYYIICIVLVLDDACIYEWDRKQASPLVHITASNSSDALVTLRERLLNSVRPSVSKQA
jgi:hypothetical protein